MAGLRSTLPVGFTMGDAAGIGPEIIVKTFAAGLQSPAIVYGDVGVMQNTVYELGYEGQLRVEIISEPEACSGDPHVIPVLNRWQPLPDNLPMGQPNAEAGRGAYEYLCHAIDDAMAQRIRAIVTAPLNKKAMQ
ncbi:MAG TPA: 4-hydroxythreonine-4-phosphate dehydrogenase PdxA, partial [Burkholderiaceae bacterium]|nr:4-hydroxythreonine-4-phosphate dehydrogenase PdxA [Burkholderiaceae bacterium]